MRKHLFLLGVLCMLIASCTSTPTTKEIKVLQFNIWQEGTTVPSGYEALISQIIQSEADFVTLSEVRNYNNTRFNDRIVESLKDRGYVFYSFYSDDSGLISKYPIKESNTIYPLSNDEGSAYRALIDMDGQEVALYTCHLDYRHCTYYDVYGYSGTTWKKLDEPLTDIDAILADNTTSKRDDAMAAIIEAAKKDRDANRLVFIGGDYNEPSHLDWVEETKDMYNHQGLVIPWTVNKMLDDANFIDSFRTFYPNPVTHPGFTFPSANPYVDIKHLLWAADSDERERVDYIHFADHAQLKLKDVVIWGPKESIKEGKVVVEESQDVFKIGKGVWPTDHKALLATFTYTKK